MRSRGMARGRFGAAGGPGTGSAAAAAAALASASSWSMRCATREAGLLVAVGAQAGFVVGPAGFDLDPDFQVDGAAEQFFHVEAGLGGNLFQAGALVTDQHGLVGIALDQHGRKHAPQIAFLLELLDQHGAGVRQFIAHQAEHFFTHDFGGEEFSLRSVMSSGPKMGAFSGSFFLISASSASTWKRSLAETGTTAAKSCLAAIWAANGIRAALSFTRSDLLMTRITGTSFGNRSTTCWSAGPKVPASTRNRITSAEIRVLVTVLLSVLLRAFEWRVWKPGVST